MQDEKAERNNGLCSSPNIDCRVLMSCLCSSIVLEIPTDVNDGSAIDVYVERSSILAPSVDGCSPRVDETRQKLLVKMASDRDGV